MRAWCVVLVMALAACGGETPAGPAAGEPSEASPGAALFARNCAGCHGDRGQGTPLISPATNFTNATWHDSKTDAEIEATIRSGNPGTQMPSFSYLEDDEIAAIVRHVRSLGKR